MRGIIRVMNQFARCLIGFSIAAMTMCAADLTGIWAGTAPGRRGDKEDIAFQFNVNGSTLTGKMFGDEFDLPLEEASVSGDHVKFMITTTNYYSRTQVKFVYTGTIKGDEIELTRTRVGGPPVEGPANRQNAKQTLTIKRLT
jgi:hypothetical protein